MLKLPIKEPNRTFISLAFLLNKIETLNNKIKSKLKLSKKRRSKYKIIISPILLYKKNTKNCVVL